MPYDRPGWMEGPDWYGPGFRGYGPVPPWWARDRWGPLPRYGRYEAPPGYGPSWSDYGDYEPGEVYRAGRGWYRPQYGSGLGTSGYTGSEPWREPHQSHEPESYEGGGGGGPAGPEWRGYEAGPGRTQRYGSRPRSGPAGETLGRYSGRGPKTYHRSDERIEEEVNDELTRAPDVDASDIEVQVQDRVVTLTGMVQDRHMKRIAEDIAEAVIGVTEVQNRLRVGQAERTVARTTQPEGANYDQRRISG